MVLPRILQVRVECSTPVLVLIPGTGISIAATQLETLFTLIVFDFCSWAPTLGIQLQPRKTFQRKSGILVSAPRCVVVKWQSRGGATTTENTTKKTKIIFFPPPDSTENSRFILLAWCYCLLSISSEVSPCEKIGKNLEGKKMTRYSSFQCQCDASLKVMLLVEKMRNAHRRRRPPSALAEHTNARGRCSTCGMSLETHWVFFSSWSFCFVLFLVFFPS